MVEEWVGYVQVSTCSHTCGHVYVYVYDSTYVFPLPVFYLFTLQIIRYSHLVFFFLPVGLVAENCP